MYHDLAMSTGGASAFSSGPPLALYDLISSQKAAPMSYAYSCDMSVLGEEDEEQQENGPSDQSAASPPLPASESHDRNTIHDPTTTAAASYPMLNQLSGDTLGNSILHPPSNTEIRPRITQRETFPQTAKRPNWQMIRYQTAPGRADKEKLDAWIGGWSESIGELGDETYCACADSTVAASSSRSSLHLHEHKTREYPVTVGTVGTEKITTASDPDCADTSAETPPLVSFMSCPNCLRQYSPAVIPDADFAFPPASGAGKMALKCKLVWKKIFDRTVYRRQDSPKKHERATDTPVSQTALRGAGYGEGEDEDEEELDVDKLSASSGEGRAGDGIAERQARLRRAQRLLRKESRKMREAG